MKIPKEISEKIREANRLNNEVVDWMQNNLDCEGMTFDNFFWDVVPEPQGEEQDDGEYCDQHQYGEDWFVGNYYWEMPDSLYLCMHFELF